MKISLLPFLLSGKRNTRLLLTLVFSILSFWATAQNCSVNAGTNQTICGNDALILHGNSSGLLSPDGSPFWSQVSGPSTTIVHPDSATTEVINFTGGNTYTYRFSATCEDGNLVYQDVTITVLSINDANAGPDATYCPGTSTGTLSANSPGTNENGLWTGGSAGITVDDNSSPTSTVSLSGSTSGNANLVWTLTNTNGCTSSDTVVITNRGGVTPVDAGQNDPNGDSLSHCYSSTQSMTFAASYGGSGIDGQQGTWTTISGSNNPTIANPNSASSSVTNLIEGTYVFRWDVSGPCVNGSDSLTVIVPAPTSDITGASVSGGDQVFCDGRTSTVLEGSIPQYVNETVKWTQPAGQGAVIVNDTSPTTQVTGLDGSSSYTFYYTITNDTTDCSSQTSVQLSYMNNPPVIDITQDQIFLDCDSTTAYIDYTYSGSGLNQYRITNGPVTAGLTYPTDWETANPTPAPVSGLDSIGTYTIEFRRHTSVDVECGTATDVVEVTTSRSPSEANAGTFQILGCNITSTNLAGNAPEYGTGTWSQVFGPTQVTLSDPHDPSLGISGLSNGFYTFQWLISGGPGCDPNTDRVTVLVSSQDPTAVSAGSDTTVCYNTTLIMDADPPTYIFEQGTWTVDPAAGVTIDDTHDPNTAVTGLQANTVYTFVWTIRNGCNTVPGDTAIVTTTDDEGPIDSDAGDDQCLASGTTTITLDGNDPTPGTGIWTQTSGPAGATITDNTLYNTTVTVTSDGNYEFEWAISSGGCNPSLDTVLITIDNPVTQADAGADDNVCGDSTRLTGNNPTLGVGQWTQVSGNFGDTIRTPDNYITDVVNLETGVYDFAWTITNGACSSADTVRLNVSNPAISAADAGSDIAVCQDDSTQLNAVAPTVGSGLWSVISGPNTPTLANPSSDTSGLYNMITGTYQLMWTVSSTSGGACAPNRDTVEVSVVLAADAGSDQDFCDAITQANLVGTTSSSGIWTQDGTTPSVATLDSISANSAVASDLVTGQYTFVYAITEPGCSSTDTMHVTLYDPASMANAGPDQEQCNETTFYMDADAATTGTGTWSKASGPDGGSFTNANNPTTTYINATPGVYIFEWTVANQSCSNTDQVRITNYEEPTTANAGPDQTNVCGTEATMAGNTPAVGVGNWSIDTASLPAGTTPVIQAIIQPETQITNMIPDTYPGVYKYVWTISNGTCTPSSDTVVVTV
ncbi:MAG: hypothetical protein DRJ09_10595, partial [Bacteroidetes bacterium]